MSQESNRITNFWQELKRRKVTRTITVYAAAAFVILELVSIIVDPLKLPEWTLPMIIVLLCVGFIIAIILSWIYDIHPEGGMVKTEAADKVKVEDIPKSSNSWKIASYISFVVIVGLIVLNIVPKSGKKEILDKSIAVLPLDYLSEDPNKEHLANGVLDALTGHLSMIEGLRVMPRTSVEQYREIKKPAKEIGEELGVSYLIEGSFQMIGDQVKLIIQLVDAEEGDHVFFREYDREYKDIFAVQSEVAKTIAREIEVIITPEEKVLIEKIPTTDLTAYDFLLKGEEEMMNSNDERAEELFNEALRYDSTYAEAYVLLGSIYGIKSMMDLAEDHYRDTVWRFIDKAIYYDDELPEAYILKGNYYQYLGQMDQAILAYEKAFKLKPNDYWTNFYIGYYYTETDYVKCINAYHRAASLSPGNMRSQSLKDLGIAYSDAGFEDKALEIYSQVTKLDGDSSFYYRRKAFYGYGIGDIEQAIKYFRKAHLIDSTSYEAISDLLNLGLSFYTLGKYQESLDYMESVLEFSRKEKLETIFFEDFYHRLALIYLKNGFREESEHYFNRAEEILPKSRELTQSAQTYYELAAFNVLRGDKEQALEYLGILNQRKLIPFWRIGVIKLDELFDSIRDEPEFQQIVRDVEAKFQEEHERVRQWLEENDR